MTAMTALGVAVVGAAGWGQNVVRAFHSARGANLRCVCDLSPALLAGVAERYPTVTTTLDFERVLADPDVGAVAIAVDAPNHHRLAKATLLAGRHLFVEKPLTLSSADAEELCLLAEVRRLTLMVGHLLLYHPAVVLMKAMLDAGEVGEVLYLHAQRVNLGLVRQTENAWWSLAPHDVALAIHLFGEGPVSVSATGATFLQRDRGVEDVAFGTLRFADGRLAHLHVSWLDPHKRRSLTVVGTRKMLSFDDALPDEKLKIYDHAGGVGNTAYTGHVSYAQGVVVPVGDVVSPFLPAVEPLLAECEHFVDCVRGGLRPRSDGRQGLQVVRVLEAGEKSMRAGGAPVPIAIAAASLAPTPS